MEIPVIGNDDDERVEIPVIEGNEPGYEVELPDNNGELVVDPIGVLASYMVKNNISATSEEGYMLMMDLVAVAVGTSFDYRVLDLDGNRILTHADLSFIIGQMDWTVNSIRLENMYNFDRAILRAWN